MNLYGKIALTLLPAFWHFQTQDNEKSSLLSRKLSFTVHRLETLESVLNRVEVDLGTRIGYSARQLSSFTAKAAVYKDTPVKTILDQQFAGKSLSYRLHGNQLQIVAVEKQ
ncbi:hypothetical protein C7T94_09485 [Pedobacter yulinensis]|uniref:Uncharacterized protein n=1 Tax=Pedobacter yulinensis TaxID=2126353 RepID=A0A2T3HKB3_9SPHI|nr:hypothetical protein [Pedobacter yulinensis]PST82859.1 hypothetical protein C7T94_09485 [Pedobacter yulinensis]